MKISELIWSIRPSIVWYVVTNLSWKKYGKKVSAIADVCLHEVSPTSRPGYPTTVGMLVSGRTQTEAERIVKDILESYGVLKP